MAIYQHETPSHIVEFKIFDERNQPTQIASDLDKAKRLARLKPVAVVLGVMICGTSRSPLRSRIDRLRDELGPALEPGEPQQSVDAQWEWCFGCYFSEAV